MYNSLPFEVVLIISRDSHAVWWRLVCVDRNLADYTRTHLEEVQDLFTSKVNGIYRLPNKVVHRGMDKPAVVRTISRERWYHGERHREGDLREWWYHGERHREGDKPAVVNGDLREWWHRGKRHREGDKPAVTSNTFCEWYYYGVKHRGGSQPAEVHLNGSIKWYVRDILHRDDGPAIIYANGKSEWYTRGIRKGRGVPFIYRDCCKFFD
jgi:hypothetical protein